MPCIPHLMVMNLRQIVRGIQIQDVHVQASNRTQERVGRDHPIPLSQNQPGAGIGQILLGVEDVDGCALSSLRFPTNPPKRYFGRMHLGFGGRQRDL